MWQKPPLKQRPMCNYRRAHHVSNAAPTSSPLPSVRALFPYLHQTRPSPHRPLALFAANSDRLCREIGVYACFVSRFPLVLRLDSLRLRHVTRIHAARCLTQPSRLSAPVRANERQTDAEPEIESDSVDRYLYMHSV